MTPPHDDLLQCPERKQPARFNANQAREFIGSGEAGDLPMRARANGWTEEQDKAVIEYAAQIEDDVKLLVVIQRFRPQATLSSLGDRRLFLGILRHRGARPGSRLKEVLPKRSCPGCGHNFHPAHDENHLCPRCKSRNRKIAA